MRGTYSDPVVIKKMHHTNQFSVRSDIIARLKAYNETLVVDTPLGRVEIPPDKIDSRVLYRSEWQDSKFNIPYKLCYMSIKQEAPKDQIKMFDDIPATNAPQRLNELQGMLK